MSQARRESYLSQQERVLDEVKENCERHAQELILKESALREKERLHGYCDRRMEELRHAEAMHNQRENTICEREASLTVQETDLEATTQARHLRYEELIKPLLAREQRVLDAEQQLRRDSEKNKALMQKEARNVAEQHDSARALEERATALHQQATDTKTRVAKKEAELDQVHEQVAGELRSLKKKSEEIEQRARSVEWKEKELESDTRKMIARDLALRQSADEVEMSQEELRLRHTEMQETNAAVDVQKLELKMKIQHLIQLETDMKKKMEKAISREAATTRNEKLLGEKLLDLQAKENNLLALQGQLRSSSERLAGQETALAKLESDLSTRLKVIESGERELLAWLRELKWREEHLTASSLPASTSTTEHFDPTMCVQVQLRSVKTAYLSHLQRNTSETKTDAKPQSPKPKGKGARKDLFSAELSAAKNLQEIEKRCNTLRKILQKYRAKYNCLDTLRTEAISFVSDPPQPQPPLDRSERSDSMISHDASLTLPSVEAAAPKSEEGDALLARLSPGETSTLSLAMLFETSLVSEQRFLKTLEHTPLLARLNCTPDSVVIRDMEEWYLRLRTLAGDRIQSILAERLRWLDQAVSILKHKAGPVENRGNSIEEMLRNTTGVGGGVGGGYRYRPGHVMTDTCRANTLIGTQKANIIEGLREKDREKQKPAPQTAPTPKPKKLTPLQTKLRLVGVNDKPVSAYLKHYFDTPIESAPTEKQSEMDLNISKEKEEEGGEEEEEAAENTADSSKRSEGEGQRGDGEGGGTSPGACDGDSSSYDSCSDTA